jgi:hypothetical protein
MKSEKKQLRGGTKIYSGMIFNVPVFTLIRHKQLCIYSSLQETCVLYNVHKKITDSFIKFQNQINQQLIKSIYECFILNTPCLHWCTEK